MVRSTEQAPLTSLPEDIIKGNGYTGVREELEPSMKTVANSLRKGFGNLE
jgi:triphosphoribosyl-dephospho-CoA synthetase